jgi:hypothetical protein
VLRSTGFVTAVQVQIHEFTQAMQIQAFTQTAQLGDQHLAVVFCKL